MFKDSGTLEHMEFRYQTSRRCMFYLLLKIVWLAEIIDIHSTLMIWLIPTSHTHVLCWAHVMMNIDLLHCSLDAEYPCVYFPRSSDTNRRLSMNRPWHVSHHTAKRYRCNDVKRRNLEHCQMIDTNSQVRRHIVWYRPMSNELTRLDKNKQIRMKMIEILHETVCLTD
jgi:hypothetical protein